MRYTSQCLTVSLSRYRFINFYEAIKVNSAVIHLMGFLVLLATLQLWNLLHHNPRLQIIHRTLSKAWDEVVSFLLVILILLTGYAIAVSLHSWCLFLSAVILESRCFPYRKGHYMENHQFKLAMSLEKR